MCCLVILHVPPSDIIYLCVAFVLSLLCHLLAVLMLLLRI